MSTTPLFSSAETPEAFKASPQKGDVIQFAKAIKQHTVGSSLTAEEIKELHAKVQDAFLKINFNNDSQAAMKAKHIEARVASYVKVNDFITKKINEIAATDINAAKKELLISDLSRQKSQILRQLSRELPLDEESIDSWVEASLTNIETKTAFHKQLAEVKLADKEITELLEKHVNPPLQYINMSSLSHESKLLLSSLVQSITVVCLEQFRKKRDSVQFEKDLKQIQTEIATICECASTLQDLIEGQNLSKFAKPVIDRYLDNALNAFIEKLIETEIPESELQGEVDSLKTNVQQVLENVKGDQEHLNKLGMYREKMEKEPLRDPRAQEALLAGIDVKSARVVEKILTQEASKQEPTRSTWTRWLPKATSSHTRELTGLVKWTIDSSSEARRDLLQMEKYKDKALQRIEALDVDGTEKEELQQRLLICIEQLHEAISLNWNHTPMWTNFQKNFEKLLSPPTPNQ